MADVATVLVLGGAFVLVFCLLGALTERLLGMSGD